jgi:hypothetical protein
VRRKTIDGGDQTTAKDKKRRRVGAVAFLFVPESSSLGSAVPIIRRATSSPRAAAPDVGGAGNFHRPTDPPSKGRPDRLRRKRLT